MTATRQLTCPDCGCHVIDHERFVGPHSRRCGWWDGRTTEAVAYALGLGDRAPAVRGLGPWPGASSAGLPNVPFIVFTRDHGAWEDVAGFGYATVIDGGTVSADWTDADLFARGKVGVHVVLLGDQADQLRAGPVPAEPEPADFYRDEPVGGYENQDGDEDWDLDGPAHVREEPEYQDDDQPAGWDRGESLVKEAALGRLNDLVFSEAAAMELWWRAAGDDWPVPDGLPAKYLALVRTYMFDAGAETERLSSQSTDQEGAR